MLAKLSPIQISEEDGEKLQQQFGTQEISRVVPKSTDPKHFPVFDIPVNKKVLIYVPKHTYIDADGVEQLRMDKPLLHSVTDGNRYYRYRCIDGIVDEKYGLDGSCPLCDGTDEPWQLANLVIKERCEVVGLDPEDKENPAVKSIRSAAFTDRVIKDPTRYLTFPIVVFDTVNDDAKTIAKDENGNISYKIMWYSISEAMYEDKWKKTLEGMEDEPTNPGGYFFMLNYCYTPKNGEPNKMDSARNLAVNARTLKGTEKLREALDKQSEHWTPLKAQQTVIDNQIYNVEQLKGLVDGALERTRMMIAMYQTKALNNSTGIEADTGFQLEQKASIPSEDDGNDVEVSDSDLDMTM